MLRLCYSLLAVSQLLLARQKILRRETHVLLVLLVSLFLWSTVLQAQVVPQYPVIFVHGLGSTGATWADVVANVDGGSHVGGRLRAFGTSSCQWRGDWSSEDLPWAAATQAVVPANKTFFAIDFSDADDLIFQEQADELKTVVNCVRLFTGAAKVILVGHSMGGLASRAYVQGLAYSFAYSQDVERVITVGTPHGGFAYAGPITQQVLLAGTLLRGEALAFLQRGSIALGTLNAATFPQPSPSFVSIRAAIPAYGSSTGDGVVDAASQSLSTTLSDFGRPLPAWVVHSSPPIVNIPLYVPLVGVDRDSCAWLQVHTCETSDSEVIARIVQSIPRGTPDTYQLGQAITNSPVNVGSTVATLKGEVLRGQAVSLSWQFELGLAPDVMGRVGQASPVSPTEMRKLVSYSLSGLMANVIYYYRLCASDGAGGKICGVVQSFGSVSRSPTLSAPLSAVPVNGASGLSLTPTLQWTSIANASSYRVIVASSAAALPSAPSESECVACVINVVVRGSSLVIPVGMLQPSLTYYWRVKARSLDRNGEWSLVAAFATGAGANLAAPNLSAPANGTQINTSSPLFAWTSVASATSYRIVVARNSSDLPATTYDSGCANCVVNEAFVGTTYTPSSGILLPGQTYYWKVKARSPTHYGDYSATRSFTLTEGSPAGGTCAFNAIPGVGTFAVDSSGTLFTSNLVAPPGCPISVTNSNPTACVVGVPASVTGAGVATLSIGVNATGAPRSCAISITGITGAWTFNQAGPSVASFIISTRVFTNGAQSSAGGSVSGCSGSVANGTVCSMVATPNPGYIFAGWAEDANVLTNSATYAFTVNSPRVLTASFQPTTTFGTYAVSIAGPPEARMRPSDGTGMWRKHGDTVQLAAGSQQSVQCSAVPNYTLTGVTSPSFIASAGGGALQCTYSMTTNYLSPLLSQAAPALLAAGSSNSLARLSDGSVVSWGLGQYGLNSTGWGANAQDTVVPLSIAGISTAVGVVSDRGNSLAQRALLPDGTMLSWGLASSGNLGTGASNVPFVTAPTPSSLFGTGIRKVVTRGDLVMLRTNGEVWRLALSTSPVDYRRLQVPANVVDIASRGDYAYALDREGRVWNIYSADSPPNPVFMGVSSYSGQQSGFDVFATYEERPAVIPGLSRIVALSSSPHVSLALRDDGTVFVWGNDNSAILAGATYPRIAHPQNDPVAITSLPAGIKAIETSAGGGGSAFAVDAVGNVWSWGENGSGQLGRGPGPNSPAPAIIPGLTNVVEVAAGEAHVLALKGDGTVWAWGANQYGMLGNGTKNGSSTPEQVLCPSGSSGFLNLLNNGCTVNATNLLTIDRLPTDPVSPIVTVNGTVVTLPFQGSFPSSQGVSLDIDSPNNFGPLGWRGDIDTVTGAFTSSIQLPMNRDWSLTARVSNCVFSHNNDLFQSNVAAVGATIPVGAGYPFITGTSLRCRWTASSDQPWLRASKESGVGMANTTGSLGLSLIVDSNPSNSARTGHVTIGTLVYEVTQLPASASSTPDAFGLDSVQNAIEDVWISSSTQVTGINVPTSVSVSPGAEYSVNGGAYMSAPSTVGNYDLIAVRVLSGNAPNVTTSATLTVGGVSSAPPLTVTTAGCALDIDGNGVLDPLTDGLLLARFAMGLTGTPLVAGAIGAGASRTSSEAIIGHILAQNFDFDNDGKVGLTSDVPMAIRSLRGLVGAAVTVSVMGTTAQRSPADTQGRVAGCR